MSLAVFSTLHKTVEVDGLEVLYREGGHGRAVVRTSEHAL